MPKFETVSALRAETNLSMYQKDIVRMPCASRPFRKRYEVYVQGQTPTRDGIMAVTDPNAMI